jgi:hypothetical protein
MKTKILVDLIILGLLTSCGQTKIARINPTNNKGGYTITTLKNNKQENNTVIYGYVKDYSSKKPLAQSLVKLGCSTFDVDNSGFYKIKGSAIDNIFLTSISIGYKTIETDYFKLDKSDSTNINFFLSPDDRPLINCEGKVN